MNQAIQRFLDDTRGAQTAFLAELVKCPSDNPPGDCAGHAALTATLLEAQGLTVERHPVPEALARANGMVSATNLVVRQRFGSGGPVIALNAHGDVVPPGEGWTHDPYGAEIVDGWMTGRGVAVSKSDFATYAWALLALRSLDQPLNGPKLNGTVELHLTYDEEAGGEIGPAWLLREGISRPDLAIGAGFSCSVVNAHNGCLHLEVRVEGRSAHAAKPATGVDALEAASALLAALYAWRKGLAARASATPGIGSPQMTIGLIEGGINTNVVPDRVTFRLDRRIIPEENPGEAEEELRQVIAEAATAFPSVQVSVQRILLAAPLTPLAGAERLTKLLCANATRIMGEPVAPTGVPVVLYGAGPHSIEEANAHRAGERLPLDDSYKATLVIALTLAELLGGEAKG